MTPRERGRSGPGQTADWRRSNVANQGLRSYLTTLRERAGLIAAVVALTLGAAALYLLTADKVYEAEAGLLVTPVSSEDLPGLGLIQDSPDPTRDVETAAALITKRDVAVRVAQNLGLDEDPDDLLGQVEAEPVAQSNIVAVTAEADTPEAASDLANGFGEAVVEVRTEQLHEQLDGVIERLQERLDSGTAGSEQEELQAQVARLETLRAGPDPTLRLESPATAPDVAASPKPRLTIIAALLGGLVLGVGGAFALNALDPRLRREAQLGELFQVPILARIPTETRARTSVRGARQFGIGPHRRFRRALGPGELSPVTLEAYRTLRAMLGARRQQGDVSKSVLMTGPSPSEGKTTSAINLASSFALAGHKVILIEADFRRPTVGQALNVRPRVGIGKVLLGEIELEEALVPAPNFGDELRLLLVDRTDEWLPEVLSLPTAGALIEKAEQLADFVVIDSPPLTEVIDALPIAQQVDDVVLVVRLGSSKLVALERLGDLLAQHGIRPAGFAVVGVGTSDRESYYLSSRREMYKGGDGSGAPPRASSSRNAGGSGKPRGSDAGARGSGSAPTRRTPSARS
jgi:capsular exopolysaccharide synthesis family protein